MMAAPSPIEAGTEALAPAATVDRLRTIVQDAHLNFLIGAGTPSQFFSPLGDIENVLTALDASGADADAKAIARASIQAYFFDSVIEPNRRLLAPDEKATTLLRSYARFGRALNLILLGRRSTLLSKKVSLFTTNVDLAFEVAFERLGLELIDGFSGKIRPTYDLGAFGNLRYRSGVRYEYQSEIPTFDLYKLHGSIGWSLTDDPTTSSGITFDHALADVEAVSVALESLRADLISIGPDSCALHEDDLVAAAAGREVPSRLAAFQAAYDRLVIVNPDKQKFATTVLTETYYELIRRFANQLERENSVLFVHGFSFRDEHLRKLVLRAARTNPTLQVIVFCYSPSDRDNYQKLIPALHVPNDNFTYIAPPDDPDERLDLDRLVEHYLRPLAKPDDPNENELEQLFAHIRDVADGIKEQDD